MTEKVGPVYAREDYAGFIRRTLALIIDGALFIVLHIAVSELWYRYAPSDDWVTQESYVWIDFSLIILALIYCFGMRLTINGTLGYRIVGIRYAYMLGEKPSVLSILYRAAIALFLLWFFALDHIWILFDERKQAWHDKVAGFYVVKRGAHPCGTQRVNRRVINFMMLSFVVWEPATESKAD